MLAESRSEQMFNVVSAGPAITNINGVRRDDDVESERLLKIVDEVGLPSSDLLQPIEAMEIGRLEWPSRRSSPEEIIHALLNPGSGPHHCLFLL